MKGGKAEGLLTFFWLKKLRTELPSCVRTGADAVPTLSSGRAAADKRNRLFYHLKLGRTKGLAAAFSV